MRLNPGLVVLTVFASSVSAKSCNRDNCFRALLQYESRTDAAFCNQYLATPYELSLIPRFRN